MAPLAALGQSAEYRLDDRGEWVQTQAPEPGTPSAEVAAARQAIAEGKPGVAIDLMDDFIDRFDRQGHPLLPAAYLARGDAHTLDGNEYRALQEDYEVLIKRFPESPEFVTAHERELEIASQYVNGMRRRLFGLRIANAENVGEEILVSIQERMPYSAIAERAALILGEYYYRERDLSAASELYEIFERNFPASRNLRKAMERRIFANIAKFAGPEYDSRGLVDAKQLVERYAERFPLDAERTGLSDALSARIDESLGAQLLERARWYLRRSEPVSARFTLRKLVRLYPGTVAASTAAEELRTRGWAEPAPSAPSSNTANATQPVKETTK